MANKRMFSISVVDTDKFLEMPISSRLLYYELGMRADDDGFVGNWKKILLFTGLKEDDMKILISKQFIIPFESGVIVIRHWRMNNYLQNDRTKPTIYQDELKQLGLDSIFVGHEHANSASVVYQGIRFQFGQKSSAYDRCNYITSEGKIVTSYLEVGEPVVGGTVFSIKEKTGEIVNAHIDLCKK
jgi:hypothetical protein